MRPFNRNPNGGGRGGSRGGVPIMSDHLRDLDLELELLKRKREMIEKQQNLLNQQQAFNRVAYDYDPPQPFRTHKPFDDGPRFSGSNQSYSGSSREYSNPNHDFTQLYDEPQQSRNDFSRQSAKKRLGDYVWSNPPNTREFGFEAPPAKKSFPTPNKYQSPRGKFVPAPERPGFNSFHNQGGKPKPSQRFKEPPQRPRPNDFKPTKVTKPKQANANQQVFKVQNVQYPPLRESEPFPILQADKPPTQQMLGRMEMTLGALLKTIKDKYTTQPQYASCFIEAANLKEVKRLIRERIRECLIGKPVGRVTQIISIYRESNPVSTDKDILIAAMKKISQPATKSTSFLMETAHANPYQFFKKNYVKLLSNSLNTMFEKLQTVAQQESGLIFKLEENKNEASNEATEAANKSTDAETSKEDNNETAVEPVQATEDSVENQEASDVTEEKTDVIVTDKADDSVVNVEKPNRVIVVESEEEQAKLEAIRKKYQTMMEEMIPQKLATWLPRLKSQIIKVLSYDAHFDRAKRDIVKETEARLNKTSVPAMKESPVKEVNKFDNRKPQHQLKYHVKIQGRPMLPKKHLMSPFLEQFNPKMVKKIKNVRNLLYVGFDNKDDFDRMVAANGTIIGDDKIIVKISQWSASDAFTGPNKNSSTPNTSLTENSLTEKDASMKDVSEENQELNDTLDNQIEELLTSIRNEEEADNNDNEETNVDENVAEDSETPKESDTDMTGQPDDTEGNANGEQPDEIANDEGNGEIAEGNEVEENSELNQENNLETQEGENAGVDEENAEVDEGNGGNAEVDEENGDTAEVNEENGGSVETNEKDGQTAAENKGEATDIKKNDSEKAEANDQVEELKSKEAGKGTPVRTSARLASTPGTPSTIRTRRASKLAQN